MALKQILKELKDLQPPTSCNADQEIYAKDWNFSDPCSNVPTFSTPHTDQYNNTLFCNCSFPGNVCHVQSIFLVGQELDGVLPPALVKLPYTKQLYEGQSFSITALAFTISNLDLSFNILKGNILNLVDIWRLATIAIKVLNVKRNRKGRKTPQRIILMWSKTNDCTYTQNQSDEVLREWADYVMTCVAQTSKWTRFFCSE